MNIVKIMSITEILAKDPKRWKYAECTEIINDASSSESQRATAEKRQIEIKEWLRTKDQQSGQGTTTKVFHSEKPKTVQPGVDITKIDLTATEIDTIKKDAQTNLSILLVKHHLVTEELAKHGIENPAVVGMFLKLLENCE